MFDSSASRRQFGLQPALASAKAVATRLEPASGGGRWPRWLHPQLGRRSAARQRGQIRSALLEQGRGHEPEFEGETVIRMASNKTDHCVWSLCCYPLQQAGLQFPVKHVVVYFCNVCKEHTSLLQLTLAV
ncbi:unnamed protein product [Musa hybrid cultivar]